MYLQWNLLIFYWHVIFFNMWPLKLTSGRETMIQQMPIFPTASAQWKERKSANEDLNYACSDDRYSYLEGMNYYSIFNENRHMHINSQWHVHINTKTEY